MVLAFYTVREETKRSERGMASSPVIAIRELMAGTSRNGRGSRLLAFVLVLNTGSSSGSGYETF